MQVQKKDSLNIVGSSLSKSGALQDPTKLVGVGNFEPEEDEDEEEEVEEEEYYDEEDDDKDKTRKSKIEPISK